MGMLLNTALLLVCCGHVYGLWQMNQVLYCKSVVDLDLDVILANDQMIKFDIASLWWRARVADMGRREI